jgi:hypothetical protein
VSDGLNARAIKAVLGRSERWYRPTAVRRRTAAPVAVLALAGVVLAGCGGGERQDAHEPSGTFPVAVDVATFPSLQSVGSTTRLVLRIRNAGSQTVPNLAVTVNGLSYRNPQPDLADPTRPLFIVDNGPGPVSRVPVQGTGRCRR